jgi:hypothetical protein
MHRRTSRASSARSAPVSRRREGGGPDGPQRASRISAAASRGQNARSKSRSLCIQTPRQSLSWSLPSLLSRSMPRAAAVSRSASHQMDRSSASRIPGWRSPMRSTSRIRPAGTGSGVPRARVLQSNRRNVPRRPCRNGRSTVSRSRCRSTPSQSVDRRCERSGSRKSSPRTRTAPAAPAPAASRAPISPPRSTPRCPRRSDAERSRRPREPPGGCFRPEAGALPVLLRSRGRSRHPDRSSCPRHYCAVELGFSATTYEALAVSRRRSSAAVRFRNSASACARVRTSCAR